MRLTAPILASMTLVALAGCGGAQDDPTVKAETSETFGDQVEPAASAPEPIAPPVVEANVAPCPEEGGVVCSGPLVVRVENLTLMGDGNASSDGGRRLQATASVVFSNRSDGDVRVALLPSYPEVTFDNGIALRVPRHRAISGMLVCNDDGVKCFQGQPDQFQVLAKGDSPAAANLTFNGRMDGSLAASLPSVSSGTIALQVYSVDVNNTGKTTNLTLRNIPVKNQLAN